MKGRISTMHCFRKVTNDLYWVGGSDRRLELFENLFPIPRGVSYNSYLLLDEKTVLFDTVDNSIGRQFLDNITALLNGRALDYLVVNHMEPDHCSMIADLMLRYPDMQIIGNAKTFPMIRQFYALNLDSKTIAVKEGDTFSSGTHTFRFLMAPMVHWPEVMVTYDSADKVLFSADGFGKFGALDVEEEWACEARRYYIGIVGKYGLMVQKLLQKASALDIQVICPLHGPVLKENLGYYLDLYNTWSSYGVETEGTVIAYTSVYGNTRKAVELLAKKLEEEGCPKVVVNDLARCDMAEAVEDAFRYGKMVLASTTYNAEVFPFMRDFLAEITERGYQNRKVAFIENGTWAPTAAKVMKAAFDKSANITFADTTVTIKSAMTPANEEEIAALAKEMK